MAIAKMSHIRLIGLRSEQNKIIDALTERGLFEARATDGVTFDIARGDTGLCRELKLKQSRIAFALDFLKARHKNMSLTLDENARAVKAGNAEPLDCKLSGEKYSESRMLITRADFSDARAREYELLHVCDTLQKISFDIIDCRQKLGALTAEAKAYEPFAPSPVKLSDLKRRGGVLLAMYYCRTAPSPEIVLDGLPCAYDIRRDGGVLITTVCRAGASDEIDKQLSALGFARCTFDDDCTAAQKISALAAETSDVKRHMFELDKAALDYEKYANDLRILYDVIELEIERAEAEEKFLKTDSAFVLEGWLPEAAAESVAAEIREQSPNAFVQLLAPEERDEPPTLVVSNKVVAPYETITDMYSPPKYREIDPNPIMAIFYFIFFGMMIGDAAYGLILAVAGLILGCSKKFDKGVKRVLLLVGMGGISAVIWGILFGGYFAIDFGEAKIALWFNPIDEPMTMLIVSIVLGCVQMTVGYIIKFIKLCMDGKPFSAIFDAGSIILLFAALGCLGTTMMIDNAPRGLTVAAIALAVTGLALIIIFGGRNSKNPFGKIFGGFKGVYGLVNLLSDVLSYCRLFGLGLASGAIGLAFNTLGSILFGIPVIGYVVGVIILIPLHAFNIGIGVLGAYVHNARLQFLEFYGKFYDGGGRLFAPLGSRTRYIRYS